MKTHKIGMLLAAACIVCLWNIDRVSANSCTNVTLPTAYCKSECKCTSGKWKCCRKRYDFLSLSELKRKEFLNALITTRSRHPTDFAMLLDSHQHHFYEHIHTSYYFLPWHRCFILQFENLLRRDNPCMTVPYFDWSLFGVAAMDPKCPIWSETAGMGNSFTPNHCIKGNLNYSTTSLAGASCIKRTPNKHAYLINKGMVNMILTFDPSLFETFESYVRIAVHDQFHCAVGGTMCTISAANDPIFFLHHTFVDKVWYDWQIKSSVHGKAFFSHLASFPPVSGIHPSACIDTNNLLGGVKVCYENVNHTYASADYVQMPQDDSNPILKPLGRKALGLFHVLEGMKENVDYAGQIMHVRKTHKYFFTKHMMMDTLRDVDKDIHKINEKLRDKLKSKHFRKPPPKQKQDEEEQANNFLKNTL